ncbi:MAG: DUF1624 domain-containing protein [Methanolinea sp.]|nr:DUF1624 domain-containing protein [Methanolinea sp.]
MAENRLERGILPTSHVKERFREIDILRGIAVIMMVVFHLAFDLAYFGIWHENVSTGPWRLLAFLTASLFLFLVGVSLSISGARAIAALSSRAFFAKYLFRGGSLFLLGMGITAVTWFLVPGQAIVFGILHLIGVSVMLAPIFLRFHWGNLAAGFVCIATGMVLSGVEGPVWLAWLGVHPVAFASLDYTPLFPWFGVVLLGIFSGQCLYPGGIRRFPLPTPSFPLHGAFIFLGRHSLAIYLLHQPVILLAIALIWHPAGMGFG